MKLKSIDALYFLTTILLIFFYFKYYSLNVDSTWILYTSKQMLEGSKLYSDITDVNPPLIFLYSLIPSFFAKITKLNDITIFTLFVLILVFTSTFLSYKLISKITIFKNKIREIIYIILFSQTILIGYNFGEREHLFLIFIFPYLIYMIYKNEINISFQFRSFIALFAALGFNLKPHFFIIFIAIEAICLFYKKDFKELFKVEPLIITFSALVYLLIIYFFFNDYLTITIPLSIDSYTNAFNRSFSFLILNYEILFCLFAAIFYYVLKPEKNNFSIKIITVTILSSLTIYLLQAKGWSYHRIPLLGATIILIIHTFFYNKNKKFLYLVTFIPIIISIISFNISNNYDYTILKKIVYSLPNNSKIQIVSSDIAAGQPILKKSQIWASRYSGLFMIPALRDKKEFKTKKLIIESFIEDLNRFSPDYIIFPNAKAGFNYYNFMVNLDIRLKDYYENHYNIQNQTSYKILIRR